MKIIAIEVKGSYGHFRKFYTTTSPLTFAFPPPSAIAGLLGAILGLDRENNEYLRCFSPEKSLLSLKIVNPIKKVRMGTNLINTKDNKFFTLVKKPNHEPRIQVLMEFVKNPKYIFYVHHRDPEVMEKLEAMVSEKKCVYTPCLGLSQLICDFSYIGTFDAILVESNDFLEISTPIKATLLKKINSPAEPPIIFESGKKYVKELMPIRMRPDRVVEEYSEVIYEETGKSIKARVKEAYKIQINGHDEYITFF